MYLGVVMYWLPFLTPVVMFLVLGAGNDFSCFLNILAIMLCISGFYSNLWFSHSHPFVCTQVLTKLCGCIQWQKFSEPSKCSLGLLSSDFCFCFCFFVCFCFCFLWLHLQHMEVPRVRVQSKLQLQAYTTATVTPDPSLICNLCHSL